VTAAERSARREVRNPVLALPAARAIQDLPLEVRRPLGILLRELAQQASGKADVSWRQRKGIMAAYWRAVSIYARHIAHVVDPIALRGTNVLSVSQVSGEIRVGDRISAPGTIMDGRVITEIFR